MSERKSESIGKLVEALAKAQLKFDPVLKDSDNPAYRSKYADLNSVISATQPHLAAEGLVVMQMTRSEFGTDDAKMLTITTMLAHSSGEWVASDLTLPAMMRDRFDAQSVGSAITYGRRYGLQAMIGVAAEVDDDGNKAAGVGTKEAAQSVAKQKIKDATDSPVELVPYGTDKLGLRGNGVALVRAEMTEEEKSKCTFKYDRTGNWWTIPLSDGNMFASLCEKYKVPCKWMAEN